jgi:peptide deformylase
MFPADVLEQPCEKVTVFDRKLTKLIKDMYDTMIEYDGVGLAAPQIGLSLQVAIVDIDDRHGTIELINPEIVEKRGEQTGPEGCLSFPGLFGEVKRANYVKVRTYNRKGKLRIILDGVLFTSKVEKYLDEEDLESVEG